MNPPRFLAPWCKETQKCTLAFFVADDVNASSIEGLPGIAFLQMKLRLGCKRLRSSREGEEGRAAGEASVRRPILRLIDYST